MAILPMIFYYFIIITIIHLCIYIIISAILLLSVALPNIALLSIAICFFFISIIIISIVICIDIIEAALFAKHTIGVWGIIETQCNNNKKKHTVLMLFYNCKLLLSCVSKMCIASRRIFIYTLE